MIRDAQRIDHMIGFVRRCMQILDGVDEAVYLSVVDCDLISHLDLIGEMR